MSERRNKARFAFSVYNGIVIEVFRIERWDPVTARELKQKTQDRWRFTGEVANEMNIMWGEALQVTLEHKIR